ncbi:MAG: S-methyl-5-thioribose-1-phosphate isomerase [Verrucomicrobiota bacterium]
MRVGDRHFRTVWIAEGDDGAEAIEIIDQRWLPFRFDIARLDRVDQVATAIQDMWVRGAGCIGAVAGYGMYLAAKEAAATGKVSEFDARFQELGEGLIATRPTAVNLKWAVERQWAALAKELELGQKLAVARATAEAIADEDAAACHRIGEHGLELIKQLAATKANGEPVEVLTHCNAGWLAFVDHGSATAPIYAAHDAGIPIHVWVDETRPRNQGARLTAWELQQHGVDHTVIPDNVGGHLMQQGKVDLVLTGTDRTTYTGDVANKIGTYLKALAAKDNGVPFYVALPSSTFDWECEDGVTGIPIEQRQGGEVARISGLQDYGDEAETSVWLVPDGSPVANYAFDVTPARLVTGLITERGICEASKAGVGGLFPERFEGAAAN